MAEQGAVTGRPSGPIDLQIERAWLENEKRHDLPSTVRAGFDHGWRAAVEWERGRAAKECPHRYIAPDTESTALVWRCVTCGEAVTAPQDNSSTARIRSGD